MKKLVAVLAGVLLLLPSLTLALEPFNKDLKYGMMKNAEVKRMQEFLRDEGVYKGGITGNFYTLTREAVRKYQKNNGLKVTGLFDMKTRSKVNEMSVAVNDAAPINYTMDTTQNIPVGWVSNGDGTFFSPVVQVSSNQPQAPESENKTISYSENTTTSNQTTYNQPIAQKQTTTTETKTNTTQSPSSMPTSTPTSTPVDVVLNSIIINQGFHPIFPPYYPFYAYVNCSPTSTDNRLLVENIMDNGLREQDIITTNFENVDVGYYNIFDRALFNNDITIFEKPDLFDFLLKNPRIKSITVKNLGTADLKKINLRMIYAETSITKDSKGNPRFDGTSSEVETSISSIDSKSATFNFASPPLGNSLTTIRLKADLAEMKKLETIDFQITDVQLQNNDPKKIYSIKVPLVAELDGATKKRGIVTKCDLRS